MRLFGRKRYTRRMEDPKKVQDKVKELNTMYPPGKWLPVDGFGSWTDVTGRSPKDLTFNPSEGFIVKIFVNDTTGESKSFSWVLFLKDKNHE